jgi:hypothetical protein
MEWIGFTPDTAARVLPGVAMIAVAEQPDVVLSAEDIDLLRDGLGHVDMQLRWLVHLDDLGVVRVWRSWSGYQVYQVTVSRDGRVRDLRVEQDPSRAVSSMDAEPGFFGEVLWVILNDIRALRHDESRAAEAPTGDSAPPFVVHADSSEVQAWSSVRLPFEPTGAMLELRHQLREALYQLEPVDGQVLHAIYTAADMGELADVENTLLYNVGTRATRALMTSGVRFERRYQAQPPIESVPVGASAALSELAAVVGHANHGE